MGVRSRQGNLSAGRASQKNEAGVRVPAEIRGMRFEVGDRGENVLDLRRKMKCRRQAVVDRADEITAGRQVAVELRKLLAAAAGPGSAMDHEHGGPQRR